MRMLMATELSAVGGGIIGGGDLHGIPLLEAYSGSAGEGDNITYMTLEPVTITAPSGSAGAGPDYTVPATLALIGLGADIAAKVISYIPAPQAKVISAALWTVGWGAKGLAGALALNTAIQ